MKDPIAELLSRAVQAQAEGRAAEASVLCRSILAAAPEHVDALRLLGGIARERGDTGQAVELLRRACAGADTALLPLMDYAELCRIAGLLAEARQAATRATDLHAASPIAWFCLGNILLESGELPPSRSCFEQALSLQPGLAQARQNLAIVLGRLGEVEAAVREFEILFNAAPQSGEAYGGLALLLQELGFFREAVGLAETAIELQPESAAAYTHAAMIEMRLGRHWAALAHLGLALRFRPDDPQCLQLKAHLLRLVDHLDEAIACCLDAFAAGIRTPEMLYAYALALHMAGKNEEALATYDRAAARATNPAPVNVDKARLLDQLGRRDEALGVLEEALTRNPSMGVGWCNKANIKHFAAGDPDIAAMEGLLAGGLGHHDRLCLHFALAKAHMDIGSNETAFAHLEEGSRLKRGIVDFDVDKAEASMAAIAAQPTDFERAGPVIQPDRLSEVPVFVVGMPRSGSSLVEQILASHPEVYGAGELLRFASLLAEDGPAFEGVNAEDAMAETAAAYLARLGNAAPTARRVIDKDLGNFLHLGAIHRLFPRARIIHCRRDPLDTCFSAYTKLFQDGLEFTYNQTELGRYYQAYDRLMAHWRRTLPANVFTEVQYETLVADMEGESRRLLSFIGLDWHDACLRFFETARVVRTASRNQVRQPIYRSSIGRAEAFRRYLVPLTEALGALAPSSSIAPSADQ